MDIASSIQIKRCESSLKASIPKMIAKDDVGVDDVLAEAVKLALHFRAKKSYAKD